MSIPALPALRLTATRYDARATPLDQASATLPAAGGRGTLTLGATVWTWTATARPVADDGVEVVIAWECAGEEIADAALGLSFAWDDWSTDAYLCCPGVVYAGNRLPRVQDNYPPMPKDPAMHGPDALARAGNVIGLNPEPGPSRMALTAGDFSTPAVGMRSAAGTGWWLLVDPLTGRGLPAIGIEESADRRRLGLAVSVPGVREGSPNSSRADMPNYDRGATWRRYDRAGLRLRLHRFACPTVPALLARLRDLRTALVPPAQPATCLPFSAAAALVADKFERGNWNEALGRHDDGIDGDERPNGRFVLGWCGGAMTTLPLLTMGATAKAHAMRTIDWLVAQPRTPCGLIHDTWKDETPITHAECWPWTEGWTLARRHGDALAFLAKHVEHLRRVEPGWSAPAPWLAAIRDQAEALARIWERNGQFGQWINGRDGSIAWGGTTSAAMVPGGLALAARLLDQPRLLETARASARALARDLARGVTCGAPGDCLQVPDSESAFALLDSLLILDEITGEGEWLPLAQQAADLCASWVFAWDLPFPERSDLGRVGARAAGSVIANAQNRHSAPGACTLSADSLLRLFRRTGDRRHLDLLASIARALPQYLSRADRPVANLPSGWMCERVNTNDWEQVWGRGVGDVFRGGCWCETTLLLTWLEVPGIYVQSDTGVLAVVDHVEVEVLERGAGRVSLLVRNPTPFDAEVRVLCETARDAARTKLGFAGLTHLPVLRVPAGGEVRWSSVGAIGNSVGAR